MRRLSERQIRICETARSPRCKCRCKGTLHGVRQGDYTQLPMLPIPEAQQHRPPEREKAS